VKQAAVASTAPRPVPMTVSATHPTESPRWQFATAVVVWTYVATLHWHNDGLWYQGDSSRHAMNGLFWWDFLLSLPTPPLEFALSYYARYPAINPVAWPPAFYLLEGAAYWAFGASAHVAKGLVLAFTLVGTVYLIVWLRRWIGPQAGWGGILFTLQPAIITWSHAVMLNLPSMVLGLAALYHWRRWLEAPSSKHLHLAAAASVLALLTHVTVAAILVVMLTWTLMAGQARFLLMRQTLAVAGLAVVPLAVWALIALRWAPAYGPAALTLGHYPAWTLAAWSFYVVRLASLVTVPLLILVAVALALAIPPTRWRREITFSMTWFILCYLWFSGISLKETRYVLLLVPPLVLLATAAIAGLADRAPSTWRLSRPHLVATCLILFLVLHAAMAPAVEVPRVEGFSAVVTFLQATIPPQRIFYEGTYNGVFSFVLRAHDPTLSWSVTLGSKLLYATRIEPRFGTIERATSDTKLRSLLQTECGCRILVVERQITWNMADIDATKALREALTPDSFRLVRSFRVLAPGVTDIDVYENLRPGADQDSVTLPFPVFGEDPEFRVKPIQPRTGRRP